MRKQGENRAHFKQKKKSCLPESAGNIPWEYYLFLGLIAGGSMAALMSLAMRSAVSQPPSLEREPMLKLATARPPVATASTAFFQPAPRRDAFDATHPVVNLGRTPTFQGSSSIIFQGCHDLDAGMITLRDLQHVIHRNGKKCLAVALPILEMNGTSYICREGIARRQVRGENITPLHYAFLMGRADAVALLLAAGANVHDEFSFQMTSLSPELCAKSRTTSTLLRLFTTSHSSPFIYDFCTQEMSEAVFMALLQRRDFHHVVAMMKHNFNSFRFMYLKGLQVGERVEATRILSQLPSGSKIQRAMGVLNPSYTEFLHDLIFEIGMMKQNAEKARREFAGFRPEAIRKVTPILEDYAECMMKLLKDIDPALKINDYRAAYTKRLLTDFQNVDRLQPIKRFYEFVRHQLSPGAALDFVNQDLLANRLLVEKVLTKGIEIARGVDHPVYRQCILLISYEYLQPFAAHVRDVRFIAIASLVQSSWNNVGIDHLDQVLGGVLSNLQDASLEVVNAEGFLPRPF